MKKFFSLIGLLAISLFLIIYCRYRVYTTVELNGYAITSNNVAKNLYNNQLQDKDKKIDFVKVEEYENIYKRVGRLYVGEKKKYVLNESYPIFSKDSSKIVNITEDSMLIDQNFNTFDGYNGFIISSGNLYDRNTSEKIDSNTYILLKVEEGIYINTEPIKVKYNQDKEISIKMNSIIYFKEHTIRCYTLEKNTFVFHEFDGIDGINEITLGNKKINYENLLEKLGISVAEQKKEMFEENKPLTTKITTQGEKEENEIEQIEENISYVKPEISFEEKDINVYSVNGTLKSNDPSGVVTKNPTFTIYSKDNIYLRKSFAIQDGIIEISGLLPNTEFRIVGTYTYKNEKGKLIEKTFYEKEIKTKDINFLNAIELSTKIENIYSNKIAFTNIKLNNKTDDEVLKGIKKVVIKIDDDEYTLTLNQANQLKKLKEVTYETPEQLDSNKTYNYEIVIYDIASNKLKANNSKSSAKTSKSRPNVGIETEASDLTILNFKIKLNNKDNVNVSNLRYILYDLDNKIVSSGSVPNDNKLTINNLDANQIYQINVYADYDLEDGRGNIIGDLLATSKSSTNPITTLGYVRIKLEEDVITKETASFNLALNNKSTDPKLLELLETIKISILDEDKNIVKTKNISERELEKLKQDEIINFKFENLYSNTKYTFDIKSIIKQGNKEYTFDVLNSLKTFTTYKKDAEVLIINKYSNENLIDFDVRIKDVDSAIRSDRVLLQVRTASGKLVEIKDIDINKDYKQITLEKLDKEETYIFTYIAEDYNVGTNNLTYEESKVLLVDNIRTEIGIYGSIELASLVKLKKSKNLFDLSNKNKWTSGNATGTSTIRQEYDLDNNILYLGNNSATMNNQAIYYYYLPEYKNRDITISFDYKYKKNSGLALLLVGNSSNRKTANTITDSYQKFSYTTKVSATGYIEFRIQVKEINKDIFIAIKNLQIELGKTATSYEKYEESSFYESSVKINLYDKKDEINDNSYYILTYKNNELENEKKYDMSYKPLEEHNLSFNLSANHTYRIELCVKLRNRYYKISEFSVNTNGEVYGISNIDEFFSMHPSSNYIVTKDLDFKGTTKNYNSFSGTIDFQGHRVDIATNRTNLIVTLSQRGEIKNLDLHIYNSNSKTNFYPIQNIYGDINNFIITLEESVEFPNRLFYLLGNSSYESSNINNFVINLKNPLYCIDSCTALVNYNRGTIKNGYVYGSDIDASKWGVTTNIGKNVSVFSLNTTLGGILENVYSSVNVNTNEKTEEHKYSNTVSNISLNTSNAKIRNVYSVGTGLNRSIDIDVNVASGSASNSYYVSDNIHGGNSIKISKKTLSNNSFQNNVLNSRYNQFVVDGIVDKGYYPQVKLNNVLPKQEYVELPKLNESDLPDVSNIALLESADNTAKLKVDVYNPSQEKIININIQYLTSKITDIKYDGNMTYLTVEATNPSKYLSYYYVNAITLSSAYDISYTRTYQAGEKKFNIVLYRSVSTPTEFRNMGKITSENYKLSNDIDFGDTEVSISSNMTGIIDGGGYTIKNIKNNNKSLFNSVSSLNNLNIENYSMNGSSSNGTNSIIYQGNVDNVHAKNVYLYVTGGGNIGGLLSYLSSSQILSNSSITDLNIKFKNGISAGNVGGLVGVISYANVYNSFAKNISIDATNLYSAGAIGGIIGSIDGVSSLDNIYATGTIKTNFPKVGGIVGNLNSSTIGNTYSNVNIYSNTIYVGGITGTTGTVYNSLSLGDIYTSNNTLDLVRNTISRTRGNGTWERSNNYAWTNQLYNGRGDQLVKGEILLSSSELKDYLTYKEIIKFGDYFDYTNVENGALPKLKSSSTNKVMPYQEDEFLKDPEFVVTNVKIVNKQVSSADISFEMSNPNEYKIIYVEIDDMIISNTKLFNENGITYGNMHVDADKYYDSYKISKIYYEDEKGRSKTYNCNYKIDLSLYKRISKFEDWQKMDNSYQNYILVADIDFTGKTNINHNISFNRFEGEEKSDGTNYAIKNLNINFDSNNDCLFITSISVFKNVDFENITLTNSASSGSRFGILKNNYAIMENVNFKDINISALNFYNVGIIGVNYTSMKNIVLDKINISGKYQIGGLVGYSYATINGVTASNIDISKATSNYVGGIAGYGTVTNANVKNININCGGGTYVGGIIGSGGSVSNVNASYITINTSASRVGGLQGGNSSPSNSTLSNAKITSTGTYIGGIAGYGSGTNCKLIDSEVTGGNTVGGIGGLLGGSNSYVINSKIKGNSNIGGIVGELTGGSSLSKCGVISTEISGNSYVGGIIGNTTASGSITNSYVTATNVSGSNYVGGLTGIVSSYGTISNNYINAIITADNSRAGGLIGYLKNQGAGVVNDVLYTNKSKYNLIENSTVTATSNVGGLIGYADKEVFSDAYGYSLIVANLITTNEDGNINNIIGNNEEYANLFVNTYIYEDSKINNESASLKEDYNVTYVGRDEMLDNNFYTNNLKITTTNWDFSNVAKGYFPKLAGLLNQLDIEIPNWSGDEENTSIMLFSSPRMLSRSYSLARLNNVHKLPDVYVYSSGPDRINIEFSEVDNLSSFKIGNNIYNIDKKTYTFAYNYNEDIKLEITDGINTFYKTFKLNDIKHNIGTYDLYYYYLDNNYLKGNIDSVKGKFNHIYEKYALRNDGSVYDIAKKNFIGKASNNYTLLDTVPLYTFNYNGKNIKTYYTYSSLDNEYVDKQIFVKNNVMDMVSSVLDNNKISVIMDNYNDNNYLTVLGNDGILYDLKSSVKLPNDMNRKNIKYMTSNIKNNSSIILVEYNSGSVYGFDYRTGKLLFSKKKNEDINIFDYFRQELNVDNSPSISNDVKKEYTSSSALIDKINTKEENAQTNYIRVYDPLKNKYVLYDNDNLTSNLSFNDKIDKSAKLSEYYYDDMMGEIIRKNISGIGILVAILSLIIASYILWTKFINKTEKKDSEV